MEDKSITRSDFIFFRNELLEDIKNLETRVGEKITSFSKSFQNEGLVYDQKFNYCKSKIDQISEILDTKNIIGKIDEKLDNFNHRIEELTLSNKVKLETMEKDIANACFKYDKIFLNYISSPGLIGDGCPYPTMRSFLEFSNQKIKDILSVKENSTIEFHRLVEYIDTSVEKFKTTINNMKIELSQNLEKVYNTHFKKCDERINYFDSKIDSLRLENGGYNFGLLKKTEELNGKLQNFVKVYNNIVNVVNKNRIDFNNIRKKFNSFSQLIKTMKLTSGSLAVIDEMNKKTNSKNSKRVSKVENNVDDLLPTIENIDQINKNNYNARNCIQDFNIEIITSKADIKPKKKNSFDMSENYITEHFNTNIVAKKDVVFHKKKSVAYTGNFHILGSKILIDKNPILLNKLNKRYSKTFGNNSITEEKDKEDSKQEEESVNSSNVESNSVQGKNENNKNTNDTNNVNSTDKTEAKNSNKNLKARTSNAKIEISAEKEKKTDFNILRQYSHSSKNTNFAEKIMANQKKLEKQNLANMQNSIKNIEDTISSMNPSQQNSQNNFKRDLDFRLFSDDIAKNNNLVKIEIREINEKFSDLSKTTNEKLNKMTRQIQSLINDMNKIIFGGHSIKKLKNITDLVGDNNLYTSSDISIPPKRINKNNFIASNSEKKQANKINMNFYHGPQIHNVFMKSNRFKIKNLNNVDIVDCLKNKKNASKENDLNEKSKDEMNYMSINEIESYLIKKFSS